MLQVYAATMQILALEQKVKTVLRFLAGLFFLKNWKK